ncbi:unnamed protein product [Arctia plantaginis]|uniref:Pyroglutamyl-peptidase I n=1 Tax=Arctia plantaginis TaxID=874455 RepID=A0A8S0YLD4_ARCPL|nr:unnamed protein product [Arctia plantaginis]CAB3244373.1 unnamed protein product [Arctia plantaginis]
MDFNSPSDNKIVLVTGFCTMSSNRVDKNINASGEAVKLMMKDELERRLNITLITKRVPVEYNYVDKIIPKMWKEYQPHLIIHVGVSAVSKGFTLETQARKMAYTMKDDADKIPEGCMNPSLGPENIATDLQVDLVCEEYNYDLPEDSLKAVVSNEGGNYLCEYIYYTSLCQQLNDYKSSLFVHVPPMKCQQEFEELARGLERIVEICVRQLRIQDISGDF